LLLDAPAQVAVCHYIHLNAVRAGLVEASILESYEASSFHQLWYPRKRWKYGVYDTCLGLPNPLPDNPRGRLQYRQYLDWVDANAQEKEKQRELHRLLKIMKHWTDPFVPSPSL
jgi:hypothetical protein